MEKDSDKNLESFGNVRLIDHDSAMYLANLVALPGLGLPIFFSLPLAAWMVRVVASRCAPANTL
eukprot:scaffold57154_cov17-Prasinocladus_malaysianus.AAC.1